MNGTQLFRLHHQAISLGYQFQAGNRNGANLFTLSEEFACKPNVPTVSNRSASDAHSMVPCIQSETQN